MDAAIGELQKPFLDDSQIASSRTIMGLDTHARNLNVASPDPWMPYSIGGLTPNTNFALIVWNATGDGTNTIVGPVPANSDGVVRFSVPLHGAFSLTTLPVS